MKNGTIGGAQKNDGLGLLVETVRKTGYFHQYITTLILTYMDEGR